VGEKPSEKGPAKEDVLQQSTESHRFWLATLFILGFLAIMFTALLAEFFGLYTGVKDLAAIFSGWITAIMGFYFLQQNTERAQQQTMIVTKGASDAIRTSERATEKTAKLASVNEENILELQGTIRDQEKLISELISTLEKAAGGG
jgi:hypothetical protein